MSASAPSSAPSGAAPATAKHPHLAAIERFFAAYAAQNVFAVREILAPDVVWRIPGHHPLSGPKHGVDEVLAFFDQLAQAGMKAQPYAQAVSDDYVLDFHRGWSDAGARMDTTWCLAFRFEGGRIKEVTNLCADQHAADAFFWSLYRLKPIPDRLAAPA
jgi:ketosteroid isomerase-like protein